MAEPELKRKWTAARQWKSCKDDGSICGQETAVDEQTGGGVAAELKLLGSVRLQSEVFSI